MVNKQVHQRALEKEQEKEERKTDGIDGNQQQIHGLQVGSVILKVLRENTNPLNIKICKNANYLKSFRGGGNYAASPFL